MSRNIKVLFVVVAVLALAGAAYGFAAANTIASSGAGYKASEISGYAIDSMVYNLSTSDPTKLASIEFAIAPIAPNTAPAVNVKISTNLVSPATGTGDEGDPIVPAVLQDFTTSTCHVASGVATCTFITPINVADVKALDVVASSNLYK
jgi:hypothetical protein